MKGHHRVLLLLASLPLLATTGCSLFGGSSMLSMSGTIIIQKDNPVFLDFTADPAAHIELNFDNRGPGTVAFRESMEGSEMLTVTPADQSMSYEDEVERLRWVLTTDDRATVIYNVTSDGSSEFAIRRK